jgi:peptidoglycan/LPS O-acetylase OafA/YrhL
VKRLEFLDGLRGIAALCVILDHVPLIISPQLAIRPLVKPFIMYGWTGVELFFVISGYSLTMTIPSHYRSNQPMVSYAISRLSRIAPLFYVLIAYNIAVMWFFHWQTFAVDRIFKSVLFVFNLSPSDAYGIVGASWTIGVEMLFYAVFPLVYFAARDVWRALAISLFAVVISNFFFRFLPVSVGGPDFVSYRSVSFVTFFSTFVLGTAAFWAHQGLSHYPHREGLGSLLTVLGIAGLSWLITNPEGLPFFYPSQSPGIFYALMIIGLGLAPWRIFANPIVQFYGRICYSMYLWHPPVIFALEPLLHRIHGLGCSAATTLLLCYALVFAVVTVVATASHHLIEVPGLKLGQNFKAAIGQARFHPLPNSSPAA